MATVFRTLSLWLVVSFLLIASATERLAVLELSGDAAPTTVMQQLSDKLRAGALEAIRAGGSELEIMTRESMAAILGDMGLDVACIEGQCEVETARNLRAAYVVSGSMIKLEGEYILTVKLHESKSGSLLGADETESASLRQLRQGAQDTGYRLLTKGLGLTPQSQQQGGAIANVQEGRIGGQATSMDLGSRSSSALIRFESSPTGAVVLVDGNLLCPKTPCTKELSLGSHRVQMQAERYHPGEERVSISADRTVSLSLSPAFGVLKVVTEPDDLQVQINGETGGRGSFSKELPTGRYEVIAESDCLVRTGEVVALQEGETRTVRISPPKRVAGLDIRAEDSEGNAQRGEVFADGVKVGETPGRFKVPLCTKEFKVRAVNGGEWTGEIHLNEGKVSEKTVLFYGTSKLATGLHGLNLITIPAGTYTIGCTPGQSDCGSDEKPAMPVQLTRNFAIMSTEVTQSQYESVMGTNPSHFSSCGGDCPVEKVSWDDAVAFADALSKKEGLTPCNQGSGWSSGLDCTGYRLPTEAEWEVAARGGQDLLYSGSNTIGDVAWYKSNSNRKTHRVGSKSPNAYGLYDMSGNVWEWVWDRNSSDAYQRRLNVDPKGPQSGGLRVYRGGSWRDDAALASVASWRGLFSDYRRDYLGLRLVRTIP